VRGDDEEDGSRYSAVEKRVTDGRWYVHFTRPPRSRGVLRVGTAIGAGEGGVNLGGSLGQRRAKGDIRGGGGPSVVPRLTRPAKPAAAVAFGAKGTHGKTNVVSMP